MFVVNHIFPAPLKLNGEGNYALTDVKKVEVTNDFLGLKFTSRNCQSYEKYEECTTRKYLEKFQKHCSCVPYQLLNFTKPYQVKS